MKRCCVNGACSRAGSNRISGFWRRSKGSSAPRATGRRTPRTRLAQHAGGRLEDAKRLEARADLAPLIGAPERDYLAACRAKETAARSRARRVQAVIYTLLLGVIAGLVGWINQAFIKEQVNWWATMRPYMLGQVRPYVLTGQGLQALKPGASFHECATVCPEMIVVPGGRVHDGLADDEARPEGRRRPAARGDDRQGVRRIEVRRHLRRMGRLRRGRRLSRL